MNESEIILDFYLELKGMERCKKGHFTFYKRSDGKEISESMLEKILQNDPYYLGLEDGFNSNPKNPNRCKTLHKTMTYMNLHYQSGYEHGVKLREEN